MKKMECVKVSDLNKMLKDRKQELKTLYSKTNNQVDKVQINARVSEINRMLESIIASDVD